MGYQLPLCKKCKRREIECIDEWESDYCPPCNDGLIEHANERAEWRHFHEEH